MKISEETLVDTIPYTSGKAGVSVDIPRNNPIAIIRGRLNVAVSVAAVGAVTNKDGTLLNLINNMRLVVNGQKDVRISTPVKPLFHYLTYLGNTSLVKDDAEITEADLDAEDWSSTAEVFQIGFDIPFPQMAALETMKKWMQSCKLIIDWGADGDVATAATTNPLYAGTSLEITIQELLFESEAELNNFAIQHVKKTLTEVDYIFINTATTTYQEKINIPVGNIITNLGLNVLDNGVRSDALITEMRLQDTKQKFTAHHNKWRQSRRTDVTEYRLPKEKIKKGFTIIPLSELGYPDYRNQAVGDTQLQLNTAGVVIAQDKIQVLAEELNDMPLRV